MRKPKSSLLKYIDFRPLPTIRGTWIGRYSGALYIDRSRGSAADFIKRAEAIEERARFADPDFQGVP